MTTGKALAVTICIAAALPAFAARTVAISAYDDATREVSLAFGGSSSAAENVYIAYGPADCGGHFHKWPNSVNIGTIATDATTMTYTLPAAITAGTFYRFFVGDCPYDAELEYIKGDGTSWINTDYVPSSANKVDLKIYFDTVSTGTEGIFCARVSSTDRPFAFLLNGRKFRFDRKNKYGAYTAANYTTALFPYTLGIDFTSGAITTNLLSMGTMDSASAGTYTASGKLALYCLHNDGLNLSPSSNSPGNFGKFRLYYFKLRDQSDNLELDLVPVVSNNVACLYDRQRNMLYPRCGAAGGGFSCGREIAAAVASTETRILGGLTVESVNYSTGDIAVSFPALATNAVLWAVYSTNTDYGAYSPNGWDRYEKIADVTAGGTSCSGVLPALAGVNDSYSYKYMRLVLAPATEQPAPFDRQVEYLKGTGTQYIDTGIVPANTDRVVAEAAAESNSAAFIWAARWQWQSRMFACCADANSKFRFDRNNVGQHAATSFTRGDEYAFDVDYKAMLFIYAKDGVETEKARLGGPGDFTPGSNLLLFGAWNANDNSVGNGSGVRIYSFKLIDWSGALKLDLIPVTKNGVGCFYDKISGAVFANAGTGEFVKGADTATRYGMEPLLVSEPFRDERQADAPAYARMVSDDAGGWTWKFYTLEMDDIAFPTISLPDATVTVLFGSTTEIDALLADRTANGWAAGGYKMVDFTLALDGYTFPAGFDFMFAEGITLNLSGHDFALPASMRDAGVAFTVTDTSAAGSGGSLFFDVGGGAVYTNELLTLSGSLELVKTGAGEFFAAKTGQTYTGGTAVSNGVFTVGGNGETGVLGAGGALTVGAGATLEMNSKLNFLNFDLVLAGGTIANSAATPYVVPTTDSTFSNICLTAESTVLINTRYGFSSQQGDGRVRLDLGGNVFHFVCDHTEFFDLKDVTIENGTITTGMDASEFCLRGDCIATNNVTFDVGSKFVFLGNAADTLVKLQNFINRVPAANYSYRDNDALLVYGAFKPLTPYWHGLVMMDGATLDLSETEGVFSAATKLSQATNLRFAEGATITVALTNRADLAEIAASNAPYVVTWTTTNLAPANVTFQLDAATAAAGYVIAQDEYGIVLADAAAQATPFYAKMVKGEGDEYAWHFYNTLWNDITATAGVAVPNSGITVWFGSGAELAAIDADRAANGWTAKGYHTTGFDVPSDGCGVSSAIANLVISENATIDLKGHDFTLPESALTADAKFTVTDSSPAGEGGTLTVVVADTETVFNNYNISFTGSLSFVKDGAGTFTERKNGHTYTGDVTVKGGWLRTVGHGNAGVLGAPCTVTVEEGATLDFCGRYRFGGFKFVLDGGTLLSQSQSYSTAFDTETSITDLRLTKDSSFTVLGNHRYGMYAAGERTRLDLGGYKLTITSSTYFDLINTTIENGTIETFGTGGTAMLLPRHTVIATNNVTFIIHNNINFYGDPDKYTELANYVAMENNVGIASTSADLLHIWGSFVPHSAKYHGLTMMNGSTLDLSNLDAALATCSTGGTAAHGHSLLKFADNATIRVNVGNRPLKKGDYLVTWTAASKPANLNTVKFKCAGGRSFRVEVDEDGEGTDGLRFVPTGFMLIVK